MENRNNSNKNFISSKNGMNNNNLYESIKGIIPGFKDFQTLQIEKTLNINNIPNKNLSLKGIYVNKDILFNNEYYSLNNLYSSINCYVKINNEYDYGKLIITNRNIIVETNKKMMKLYRMSLSDISLENAKNNTSENEIPNYKINDTIDKILTGRNAIDDINKEMPIYLLNINLDLVTCKLVIHKEKQKFRLLLLGYKRHNSDKYLKCIKTIKFNCLNIDKNSFYNACDIINKSILLSNGYKNNLFGVNFNRNYYRKSYISVLNFVKEANSCDIILFKSFTSRSKCQRCFTKSEYDHISLLVKIGNNLKVYDCIEEDGIRLRNFTDYISMMWYLFYEKIVYRKLIISAEDIVKYIRINKNDKNFSLEKMSGNELKNELYSIINKKLELFILNNKNVNYDFPTCEYLCKSKRTKNRNYTKRNSYFCSELIAAIYIYCNIITKEYDPLDYLPGEFSEKGNIEFINGFNLGPETIIDFSN
jgi:hypothetical protein